MTEFKRTQGCEIVSCPTCRPHAFQDKTYGKNMRVKNIMIKGGKFAGYRCTVCGVSETK